MHWKDVCSTFVNFVLADFEADWLSGVHSLDLNFFVELDRPPPAALPSLLLLRAALQVCGHEVGWEKALTPVVRTLPPVRITVV